MLAVADKVDATWNSDAWPATNNMRLGTNDWVAKTNVYAISWDETIYITTETNGFIDYSTNNSWLYKVRTNTTWYSEDDLEYYPNASSLWGTIFINAGNPSNSINLTNHISYLTDINAGATNYDRYFNLPFDYNGFSTNEAITNIYWYALTDTISNKITEVAIRQGTGVQTNLTMQIKDLRGWDAYHAVLERAEVHDVVKVGIGAFNDFGFYRDERQNLVNAKTLLADSGSDTLVPKFVDFYKMDTNGTFDTYFSTSSVRSLPTLDITNVLNAVGAPSNYFEYTPYRQLGGGGIGYGTLVTQTVTLVSPNTSGVTVVDWGGTEHTVSGTNGQVITLVSTNTDILDGYTTIDYGWKYFKPIVTNLMYVSDDVAWYVPRQLTFESNWWWSSGLQINTSSWAAAQSDAETAWNDRARQGHPAFTVIPTAWTEGAALTNEWRAGGESLWAEAGTLTDWTNRTALDATMYLYLMGTATNTIGTSEGGVRTYDDQGAGYNTNNPAFVASTAVTNPSLTGITAGQTNIANWCTEPVYPGTNVQGFATRDESILLFFNFNYN